MKLSLHQAIVSLTSALDFVGVDEVHHGKRVAVIAHSLARRLGWSAQRRHEMLYAGMLHDCGVARTQEHRHLTETLEWSGAEEHCVRGEAYLRVCPPLARFAALVRWHHTRWEALLAMPDLSEEQRLEANLIFLADRVDVLLATYIIGGALKSEILWEYPRILERLLPLAGSLFAPQLVAALREEARREAFWLQCDPTYISDEIEELLHGQRPIELDSRDALAVAGLFARTVDSKSVYTLEHSTRVAKLARYLGQLHGIEGEALDILEIAGLLHDIGKLRVPEDIIDKPGAITPEERAIVKRHSYDTGRILKKVFPGLPIADWAAMHHENLLGTGYPGHVSGTLIPWEARLIAVADIFQALSQDRPYRARQSPAEVMRHLDELCQQGRVDPQMVEHVRAHLETCHAIATGAMPD